jgi:hypothetical protein
MLPKPRRRATSSDQIFFLMDVEAMWRLDARPSRWIAVSS